MKKEQSSIEFLIDNLKPIYPNIEDYKLIIRLAKDSHKKEIIGAYHRGQISIVEIFPEFEKNMCDLENDMEDAEQYYTEKYGQ